MHRKTLIPIVVAVMTAAGPGSAQKPLDRIIAIVENETITQYQLNMAIHRTRALMKQTDAPDVDNRVLIARVLQELITQKLQLQEAERLGFVIDEITLSRTMEQLAANNRMTLEELEAQIKKDGRDFHELREQVRRQLLIKQLLQREVIDNIEVSEQEIKNYLLAKSGNDKQDVEYHLAHWQVKFKAETDIPAPLESKTVQLRKELSKEGIKTFSHLKKRSAGIWREIWRTGKDGKTRIPRYLLRDLDWGTTAALSETRRKYVEALKPGQVTPIMKSRDGLSFFHLLGIRNKSHGVRQSQYHVRHVLLTTNPIDDDNVIKRRLSKIRRLIEKSGNFGKYARKYSEDPGSAFKGGDLGWNTPETFVPEFAAAIRTAHDADGIIGPFKTKFGWHILEVLDTREEDVGDEMARREAIAQIKQSRLAEETNLWLLELRQTRHVEVRI